MIHQHQQPINNRFNKLMEEVTPEDNILLFLSGGIDSTFML
jgi:tRNA(Ile)-lysidine synthase TilS/MesJ